MKARLVKENMYDDEVGRKFRRPDYNYSSDSGNTNIAPEDREQYAKDGMDEDLIKLGHYINGWDNLIDYINELRERNHDLDHY